MAGINLLWRASRASIQDSVRNAVCLAEQLEVRTVGFPVIGAGSGGFNAEKAEQVMMEVFSSLDSEIEAVLVRYRRAA